MKNDCIASLRGKIQARLSDRHYPKDFSALHWVLATGLDGCAAQLRGDELFNGCVMADYLLGVCNALYEDSELWADDSDYRALADARDALVAGR